MSDLRKQKGTLGEQKASDFLKSQGYSIIQQNFRTLGGEIDIIALKNDVIIFIEVKTLPNGTKDLLLKVLNKRKQQRIVKTAQYFLSINRQYSKNYIRFDVIVIDMPGLPQVYHIENAFNAEFL